MADMIHFWSTLDEPKLPFRRPADYYSSPVGDQKPLFPKWVPYGCGSAAIVLLVVVFLAGVFAARGGMGQLLDLMFGSMQGEIDRMFTKDVLPPQKAAFDREMKALRDRVRQNRLPIDRLQPLLRDLRDAVSDERVTPAEAEQLTKEMHALNSGR
jgi:hypothetical protein